MTADAFKQFLKRVQLFSILIISVAVITILFFPKIKERITLLNKQKQLQEKILSVQADIETIRKKEIALKSNPLYIEKLARNKLGYSKPDEIIYKFD